MSLLSPDIVKGLRRTIRVIERGIPRAKKQLAQSELELATITQRPSWEKLSKTAQNKAIREAKASVEGNKKSLISAQTTLSNLKMLI